MTNSIERLRDGSYSARFPWKETHPALPTNFWTCAHQTRSLASNLAKTPPLLSKSNEIRADQQRCGFIERVHPPDHCKSATTFHIMLSGKTPQQLPFTLFMTAAAINQGTNQV